MPDRGPHAAGPPVLVLASASTGRAATLRRAGLHPVVRVSSVDEDAVVARYAVSDPADVALVLARAKAEDVAAALHGEPTLVAGALVLGCDSVLEFAGQVHGKPADRAQALERWRAMSGRSGELHTGHWLVDTRPDGSRATLGAVSRAVVHFARLTRQEIEAYVATGEPLAVAGAFTVDGLGGAFVTGIEGDHHGVVGVSLPLLRDLMAQVGVAWPQLWRSPA